MRNKDDVKRQYAQMLDRWQSKGQQTPDLRAITSQDIMLVAMSLHRCNNAHFRKITDDLLEFIKTNEIITSDEVLEAGICTLPAFYRRMQILRKANLIRSMSKKFYVATPRFSEFYKHYRRYPKG